MHWINKNDQIPTKEQWAENNDFWIYANGEVNSSPVIYLEDGTSYFLAEKLDDKIITHWMTKTKPLPPSE